MRRICSHLCQYYTQKGCTLTLDETQKGDHCDNFVLSKSVLRRVRRVRKDRKILKMFTTRWKQRYLKETKFAGYL